MKKYDQIHETVLKDVIDLYNDISALSDTDLGEMLRKHKNGGGIKSIARASNDLICVFPVLSSRNIGIDTQAMISKAIEKNCVAMLQMLFSANQLTDATQAKDYIALFHSNINKSAKALDLDDVIQLADMIGINDAAIQVGGKVDYAVVEQVRKDMKNLNFYMESNINSKSIAEGFSCKLDPDGQYVVEVATRQLKESASIDPDEDMSSWTYKPNNNIPVGADIGRTKRLEDEVSKLGGENATYKRITAYQRREIQDKDSLIGLQQKTIGDLTRSRDSAKAELNAKRSQLNQIKGGYEKGLNAKDSQIANLEREIGQLQKKYDDAERAVKQSTIEKNKMEIAKGANQMRKDSADFFSKQVLNTEYKKANELMPTLMVINFKSKVGDGYEIVDSVIIGVKAKLYPMSSEDIITHVVAKAKDANWVQKFIKASTREISFFKDFLFAIDKAKIDALSLSKKGSANKMWKVLERRASKSKWNRLMAKATNDSTAITTLVMSQNEIDYIKKEFHIDISDVYNSRILMESYNLLGICIVDESLEIAKFMWDTGEDLWETVAFSNLERESNDNTYKKVVNLMTKVM